MIELDEMIKLIEHGRLRYLVLQYNLGNNRRFAAEAKQIVSKDLFSKELINYIYCNYPNIKVKNTMLKLLTYYPKEVSIDLTDFNKLIDLLKNETVSLKNQYIEKTKEYATKKFQFLMTMLNWNYENWLEKYNVPVYNKGKIAHYTLSKEGDRLRTEVYTANRIGEISFINKEVKMAELHYEQSIEKLAYKICNKGLNINNLKLNTTHINTNIDTYITDGEKNIHAFTILAYGEIQRPHYRYLIK